jgi:hypothetical protein
MEDGGIGVVHEVKETVSRDFPALVFFIKKRLLAPIAVPS